MEAADGVPTEHSNAVNNVAGVDVCSARHETRKRFSWKRRPSRLRGGGADQCARASGGSVRAHDSVGAGPPLRCPAKEGGVRARPRGGGALLGRAVQAAPLGMQASPKKWRGGGGADAHL